MLEVTEQQKVPEVEIFEARFERRNKLWTNRDSFNKEHEKWYSDNFREQNAVEIVKRIKFFDQENLVAKMKLKKGEQDHVLF